MNLFQQAPPANLSPLIQVVIEQKVEVEPPKTYTLEEKIKLNVNKCDESIEYIRADNAECLAKPLGTAQYTTRSQKTAKSTANASSGWYSYGYCTEWVASNRSVGQWGDASEWKWQAQRDGWTISAQPITGAIAWQPGHVALVESIDGSNVTVSEKNYKGWNIISRRTVPISTFTYIY